MTAVAPSSPLIDMVVPDDFNADGSGHVDPHVDPYGDPYGERDRPDPDTDSGHNEVASADHDFGRSEADARHADSGDRAGEPGRGRRPSVLDAGAVAAADLVRPADALGRRAGPSLPVLEPLGAVLPDGLRRGSTVSVTNSVSLLLALLGGPSAAGAWCAAVGLPAISAEAAAEYGIDLARLAIVPTPGAGWLTAVGALLDAVDVVAVRPPAQVGDGDLRRLAARARGRDAVLVPYLGGRPRWPRVDVELAARTERWTGLGAGHGRLHARQVTVAATGRGRAARPRSVTCWLPATTGGIAPVARPAVAGSASDQRPDQPMPNLPIPNLPIPDPQADLRGGWPLATAS